MKKEQEEAIEYFKKHINYFKEQIKFIEAVDSDYYDEEYELYKNRVKQFETILSMLKEKDAEIENKNRIIDLILDKINENYNKIFNNDEVKEIIEIYENIKDKNKLKGLDLRKECIKIFFERKSEEC